MRRGRSKGGEEDVVLRVCAGIQYLLRNECLRLNHWFSVLESQILFNSASVSVLELDASFWLREQIISYHNNIWLGLPAEYCVLVWCMFILQLFIHELLSVFQRKYSAYLMTFLLSNNLIFRRGHFCSSHHWHHIPRFIHHLGQQGIAMWCSDVNIAHFINKSTINCAWSLINVRILRLELYYDLASNWMSLVSCREKSWECRKLASEITAITRAPADAAHCSTADRVPGCCSLCKQRPGSLQPAAGWHADTGDKIPNLEMLKEFQLILIKEWDAGDGQEIIWISATET